MKIKHTVVSYDNAIILAERNYNIPCEWYYNELKGLDGRSDSYTIPAPSQSLTQKFLRDIHNTSVEPYAGWQNEKRIGYCVSIALSNNDNVFVEDINDCSKTFTTYEEALDAGISKALKYI